MLNALQNYGIINLQNHRLNDSAVRHNFRKIINSALILEKVLKMLENVRTNFRKSCTERLTEHCEILFQIVTFGRFSFTMLSNIILTFG